MTAEEIRQRREHYLTTHPFCQYAQALPYVTFGTHIHTQLCVEHIWNRKGPYCEHWSNYATAAPAAHDWKHRNSSVARLAIMHWKWKLAQETGNPDHFDRDALRQAAGFDVIGWMEYQDLEGKPWWLNAMRDEIVEAHS